MVHEEHFARHLKCRLEAAYGIHNLITDSHLFKGSFQSGLATLNHDMTDRTQIDQNPELLQSWLFSIYVDVSVSEAICECVFVCMCVCSLLCVILAINLSRLVLGTGNVARFMVF